MQDYPEADPGRLAELQREAAQAIERGQVGEWRGRAPRESSGGMWSMAHLLAQFRQLESEQQSEFFRQVFENSPEFAEVPESACRFCDGTGWVVLVEVTDAYGEHSVGRHCGECDYWVALGERKLARVFGAAQIPEEYAACDLASYAAIPGSDVAAARALREIEQGEPCSLYLWGEVGRGKTGLAVALGRAWLERGHALLFVTSIELLDRLRATFNRRDDEDASTDEVMGAAQDAAVLILDDIGREVATPWVAERVFSLVNYRQMRHRPTIYTSNKSLEAVGQHFDAAIASRIKRHCGERVFHVQGANLRYRV